MTADSAYLQMLKGEIERLRSGSTTPARPEHAAELLRLFFAHAPDYIAMLDTEGRFLFLNRVREGARMETVLGTSIFDWTTPDSHERVRGCLERVVRTGRPDAYESVAQHSDGKTAIYESRMAPIRDGDRVVALALLSADITERKLTERALRESEEKLRISISATGMGLWSWDVRDDQLVWDARVAAVFGLPPSAAPTTYPAYLQLVHPDDRDKVRQGVASAVRTGTFEGTEFRILRPDGDVRWILCLGSVLREPDGSPAKLVGGVLDVSERRHLEEQLRQSQKMEAVGQLTAGIAHNFNNMLMGVLPNLELAIRRAAPELVPLLEDAERSGRRAAELVRQLMTFAGKSRASSPRPESLALLVERTVGICQKVFDGRIAIETRIKGMTRPTLVDAGQLEQALLNLLINARDAVSAADQESPRVVVELDAIPSGSVLLRPDARPFEHARIRVQDNGVGMGPDTLAHIFEPFFTTKEVGRGTGLGLATTHAIVREHGGWSTCESEPGRGTTISMYLPCPPLGAKSEAGGALFPRRPIGAGSECEKDEPRSVVGTETLLVVDDEELVRKAVSSMLESSGYRVLQAASGREALGLFERGEVIGELSLVLLDLSMPGMPGRALRAHLRDKAPDLPVIFFTGYAAEAVEDELDAVLEKPVPAAELLAKVREVLDRRRDQASPLPRSQ